MSPVPDIVALIVAAGQGSRVGGDIPKQYRDVNRQPMLRHSYVALSSHPAIATVYVVVADGHESLARDSLHGLTPPKLVVGGASRRESVRNGLEAIAEAGGANLVLIHDAARPFLSVEIIDALIEALESSAGAVPALSIVDSLARDDGNAHLDTTVAREGLWRIQTPQAFHFNTVLQAHRDWSDTAEPTDDARMVMASGQEVAIVAGEERLAKFTFTSDFETGANMSIPDIRTGNGFDVHRLVEGEELWLCGVRVPHNRGLAGHSDADVAIHALVDATLGALALGDIGDHFPPSDPQWKGASSGRFLSHAMALVKAKGFVLTSADLTIICEAPKIGPYKASMRKKLAEIMDVDLDRLSVKATTTELLGFTGRGEGIAAQAVVTLIGKNII